MFSKALLFCAKSSWWRVLLLNFCKSRPDEENVKQNTSIDVEFANPHKSRRKHLIFKMHSTCTMSLEGFLIFVCKTSFRFAKMNLMQARETSRVVSKSEFASNLFLISFRSIQHVEVFSDSFPMSCCNF